MQSQNSIHNNQRGAALVVALVILVVVTVLGVANMNATTNEMRMANSSLKRAEQFAFAERALEEAELDLEARVDNITKLFTDMCGSDCFTNTCNNGLCFAGRYDSSFLSPVFCEASLDSPTSQRVAYWRDDTIWSTASKHTELSIPFTNDEGTQINRSAKYIAEFLCFVDDGEKGSFGEKHTDKNGVPIFRVTVLVENDEDGDGRVPIMLQSNYIIAMK